MGKDQTLVPRNVADAKQIQVKHVEMTLELWTEAKKNVKVQTSKSLNYYSWSIKGDSDKGWEKETIEKTWKLSYHDQNIDRNADKTSHYDEASYGNEE